MKAINCKKTSCSKPRIGLFLALLSAISFLYVLPASAQAIAARAYATGNYIFCGKELPKGFSYLVEKEVAGEWVELARLQTPQNTSECNARVFSLPQAVKSANRTTPEEVELLWQRINIPNSSLDSLYAYGNNSAYQFMVGCGWFDEGITKAGSYKYRVSKLTDETNTTNQHVVSVAFPAQRLNITAKPVSYQINLSEIELRYQVSKDPNAVGLKIFRSPYLRNDFTEILPKFAAKQHKGEMVAAYTDDTAVLGMTYSYVGVPYDDLGNPGIPTDTLNVYFVSKDADLGLVTELNVTSKPEEKGNLLKWDFVTQTYIHMIGVYRGKTYEGDYELICTLKPDEKEYFDTDNIDPAESYFYFIVLNDGLGNSIPSARFPAILEGKKANPVAPQDLTISRSGNIVTLTFRNVGNNIRGAYVYRANGYDAPLEQLPNMVLSTDELITYTDTLPYTRHPEVYSYAVASINTSYNLSPISERVNTAFSGGRLPVPDKLEGHSDNKAVWLVWSDVSDLNAQITGYQIFRRAKYYDTQASKEIQEPENLIGTTDYETNSFTDSLVVAGRDYIYRVRSVASDTTDVSSFSLPVSVYARGGHILPATDLIAVATDKSVVLQWNTPITEGIENVVVYRGEENGEMKPLETLQADKQSFEDNSAKKGVMYYYFLLVKYKNNLSSKPSDMVSAKRE